MTAPLIVPERFAEDTVLADDINQLQDQIGDLTKILSEFGDYVQARDDVGDIIEDTRERLQTTSLTDLFKSLRKKILQPNAPTDITGFSVSGENVTFFAVDHGIAITDKILIAGTISYNGFHTVDSINADDFTVKTSAGSPVNQAGPRVSRHTTTTNLSGIGRILQHNEILIPPGVIFIITGDTTSGGGSGDRAGINDCPAGYVKCDETEVIDDKFSPFYPNLGVTETGIAFGFRGIGVRGKGSGTSDRNNQFPPNNDFEDQGYNTEIEDITKTPFEPDSSGATIFGTGTNSGSFGSDFHQHGIGEQTISGIPPYGGHRHYMKHKHRHVHDLPQHSHNGSSSHTHSTNHVHRFTSIHGHSHLYTDWIGFGNDPAGIIENDAVTLPDSDNDGYGNNGLILGVDGVMKRGTDTADQSHGHELGPLNNQDAVSYYDPSGTYSGAASVNTSTSSDRNFVAQSRDLQIVSGGSGTSRFTTDNPDETIIESFTSVPTQLTPPTPLITTSDSSDVTFIDSPIPPNDHNGYIPKFKSVIFCMKV